MSLISFTLIFGLVIAVGVESWETTSLTACVTGLTSLPGNDPSRLVEKSWSRWSARYQDGSWIEIGHCVKTKGCKKSPTLLPDGTRVWIGTNESLIVERTSDQRNETAQFQFLVEDNLKRRHIYKVNFTLYCISTKLSGNLNLSQVVLGLYPLKDLAELYLLDANGTMFAQINSDKGASLEMTSKIYPMTVYRNRLRVERGSLIFHEIKEADNGTTIVVQALLHSTQTRTRLGSLSSKTIRIFVFNSAEATDLPQTSTSLFQKRLDSDHPRSSSTTTEPNGRPTKTSSDPAWYEQPWAIIVLSLVAIIIISIFIFIILFIQKKKRRSGVSSSSEVP